MADEHPHDWVKYVGMGTGRVCRRCRECGRVERRHWLRWSLIAGRIEGEP